jgi:hypothetical protein
VLELDDVFLGFQIRHLVADILLKIVPEPPGHVIRKPDRPLLEQDRRWRPIPRDPPVGLLLGLGRHLFQVAFFHQHAHDKAWIEIDVLLNQVYRHFFVPGQRPADRLDGLLDLVHIKRVVFADHLDEDTGQNAINFLRFVPLESKVQVLTGRHQGSLVDWRSFRQQVLQEFFGIDVYLWPVSGKMPPDNHVQVLHKIRMEASHQLDGQTFFLLAYGEVKLGAQVGDVGGGFQGFFPLPMAGTDTARTEGAMSHIYTSWKPRTAGSHVQNIE